jgi:Uma2 family endonuclease
MVQTPVESAALYPDSDGKPMADNTLQYGWIVRLVTNLKQLLQEQTAFVAGDLLWYPVQVDEPPVPAQAPDAMVVLGRPDREATFHDRSSYKQWEEDNIKQWEEGNIKQWEEDNIKQWEEDNIKQWEEDNIAPQVVFEILSPSNSAREMLAKQAFYGKYGVLEMFFYDPDSYDFWGLIRSAPNEDLTPIMQMDFPWISPTLGIRFEMFEDGLAVFHSNGERFKDPGEFIDERDRAFAKLRELGFDPTDL